MAEVDIGVVFSGFNQKREHKWKKILDYVHHKIVEVIYGESLIDYKNKAVKVLDEKTGKTVIEHHIEAYEHCDLFDTVIIIGDKHSLERVLEKQPRRRRYVVVQQGRTFSDNILKAQQEWINQKNILESEGKNVADRVLATLGDAFLANKESLETCLAAVKNESKDNILATVFCVDYKELKKKIPFFSRPPVRIKKRDRSKGYIRGANAAVFSNIKKFFENDISSVQKKVQSFYRSRKTLNPLNWAFYGYLIFEYFTSGVDLNRVKNKFSEKISSSGIPLRMEISYTSPEMEIDIDSSKDYKRAKKLISLKYLEDITFEDVSIMYEKCANSGCKYIEVIMPGKIKRKPLKKIEMEMFRMREDITKSVYYGGLDANHYAMLFYDLKNAYERRISSRSKHTRYS